jgi:hypothetical protein
VTIASDGSLTPLTELAAMVGLIAHLWEGLDVLGYAGIEQVNATSLPEQARAKCLWVEFERTSYVL